jgi:hypothetical protein
MDVGQESRSLGEVVIQGLADRILELEQVDNVLSVSEEIEAKENVNTRLLLFFNNVTEKIMFTL